MKPTKKLLGGLLMGALLCGLSVALASWSGDRDRKTGQSQNDTIPRKHSEPRNLDEVLEQLESMDIEEQLRNARQQVEKAMKEVDFEKIRIQMESAMKDIDFDRIEKQVRESVAKIDLDKMKEEMSNIDFEELEAELKESLEKIDMDKLKEEIRRVKEIDMKELETEMAKLKEEMKEMGPKLEKEMSKAKQEMEKARVEIREYKEFVDGLEKDGLIDKKKGFILEHRNGELFINDKKASAATYGKYRQFLEKHSRFRLVQNDKEFNLDND